MSLPVTAWPATLPLPLLDFSAVPQHQTITSSLDTPHIQRRSRFYAHTIQLDAQWVFNRAEYREFRSFFSYYLDQGSSQFLIELKYPYTTKLSTWRVRFISDGYTAEPQDGNWVVEGTLELSILSPEEEEDPLPPEDWGDFSVQGPGGESQPFEDSDGFSFYAKDPI